MWVKWKVLVGKCCSFFGVSGNLVWLDWDIKGWVREESGCYVSGVYVER